MSGVSGTTPYDPTNPASVLTSGPPVSFPGIASGIDYNSIINKITSLTLSQNRPLQNKVTSLNAANTEILKIQNLLATLQDSLTGLSDPTLSSQYTPTLSNSTYANASVTSGATPSAGTWTVTSQTLATATTIVNNASANGTANQTVSLQTAGLSLTPTPPSGSNPNGSITINGVSIAYDVGITTLNSLVAAINGNATLSAQGVSASIAGDTFQLTRAGGGSLTVGSSADVGNLAQVLKIANANPVFGANTTLTGTGTLGGINDYEALNGADKAGFATAVTSGTFTINGVQISVDVTKDNVNNVLSRINSSSAGVNAAYNAATGHIVLTNKNTGNQAITLANGSSNFLTAAGILNAGGALVGTQTVGQNASVTFQDASGATQTVTSASNNVTNAINGITLNLLANDNGGTAVPYTVTVAQSSTNLVAALNKFHDAYNAALNEINIATQPPVISTSSSTSSVLTSSQQLTTGGTLWQNSGIQDLRNQLISLVSGSVPGVQDYNSLSTIGLQLDSSFAINTASSSNSNNGSSSSSSNSNSPISTQVFQGTSGLLAALDTTKLSAALAANPNAITTLLSSATSITAQLGSYLTGVTGFPSQLNSGLVGTVPTTSLITSFTQENNNTIQSLNEQIQNVIDQANLQATSLRAQFSASEAQIAQLQAVQGSLGILGSSGH